MRILVVEDEASLAKQLTSYFVDAGYAVDHAADGPAGESADPLGDGASDPADDVLADAAQRVEE